MQLGFTGILTPQLWSRIDIEDPRGRELADRHYPRRKRGADGFVGPGRRFALWHEDGFGGCALWTICYAMDPGTSQRYQFRNTIFRNESRTRSSDLISAATIASYELFVIRYCRRNR